MGFGKSVAMGFLVDELSRRNKHQLPQPKICYYYCRDGETGQAVQIFSGLILSLLDQLPGLKKTFFGWYKEAQASGNVEPATNIEQLEELLQKVLETIDRCLCRLLSALQLPIWSSQNKSGKCWSKRVSPSDTIMTEICKGQCLDEPSLPLSRF